MTNSLKSKIVALRKKGNTYKEIQKKAGAELPKSTLSYWCKGIVISNAQKKRIDKMILINLTNARQIALKTLKQKNQFRLQTFKKKNERLLKQIFKDRNCAKIMLAMLYWAEGAKTKKGALTFGCSDPEMIKMFLHLLRRCYDLDERKFRCTLQCRADQDIRKLERFWTLTTGIPRNQFYKAQIDKRTIGKPSRKKNYKGVCRIDYFSARLFWELNQIIDILTMGL